MLRVDDRDWKLSDALSALHIDPCWFVDEFTLSVIQMFLFYRSNPHQAFPQVYTEQPAIWVESVSTLSSVFPLI